MGFIFLRQWNPNEIKVGIFLQEEDGRFETEKQASLLAVSACGCVFWRVNISLQSAVYTQRQDVVPKEQKRATVSCDCF